MKVGKKCDNESAVHVCNSGKMRDMFLNLCLHMIWFLYKFNIDLRVSHIQGCLNVIADALSRNKLAGSRVLQWDYLSPKVFPAGTRLEMSLI